MAEIHEEMSELVDKQVNVQKESLKKTSGVHAKLPQAHEKVCNENERNKEKNDGCLKYFLIEEGVYKAPRGYGFSSVGARMGSIKLAMAAT